MAEYESVVEALKEYEAERLGPTSSVVLENRRNPPDAILREIYERTGDQPFDDINKIITPAELQAISDRYKKVAAYDKRTLEAKKR